MLCDPRNCVIYRIPIGLAETQGHAAVDVAALTHSLLKAVGFRPSDLCATVNDNTSAAVLAGKYIVGEHASKGKCDMHRAELVLKHATGLIKRYQNKTLIDSFPAFVDAWQVAKEFASYLCSRKASTDLKNSSLLSHLLVGLLCPSHSPTILKWAAVCYPWRRFSAYCIQ